MAVAIMPLLFAIYLLLWITSFVDSGYLSSESEAKKIYARIVTITICAVVVCLPLIGWLTDRVPARVLAPISFAIRGSIAFTFVTFVDKPDSVWTIVVSVLMIISCMLENVCINALFMRTLPAEIRGAMTGLFHGFG